ncbi:uncharacterized protein [Lepeophtheirus salmonis]|uniref:Protein Skeletor, isoforms D/Elike [Musca domestica] n=1 Tax=Lepeophtheirus salmonis TaxID=72036 RepID=A0A0K2UTE0_LEPSM|nr:protein Skeletor, isoforms B/C-like [Lepeophtheirus salmonis]
MKTFSYQLMSFIAGPLLLFVSVKGIQKVRLEPQQRGVFVSGNVSVVDKSRLRIEHFNFDGNGLESFFYVGQWGQPGSKYGMKVDYPKGNPYATLLQFKNQNVTLQMPDGVRTWDLRWISIWSAHFRADYGHAYVGRGIFYDVSPKTTEPPLYNLEYLYQDDHSKSSGIKSYPRKLFWGASMYLIIKCSY